MLLRLPVKASFDVVFVDEHLERRVDRFGLVGYGSADSVAARWLVLRFEESRDPLHQARRAELAVVRRAALRRLEPDADAFTVAFWGDVDERDHAGLCVSADVPVPVLVDLQLYKPALVRLSALITSVPNWTPTPASLCCAPML